jgi:hypothetical protein
VQVFDVVLDVISPAVTLMSPDAERGSELSCTIDGESAEPLRAVR